MRILHVADLHLQHAWFDWVASNAPAFDALVIAGDLLDGFSRNPTPAQVAEVSDWLLQLRVPTVVCSGNHDDLGSSASAPPGAMEGAEWLRNLRGRGYIVGVDGDVVDVAGTIAAVNGWRNVPDLPHNVDLLVTHAPPAGCFCADSRGQDFGDPSFYEALAGGLFPATWLLCGHVHVPRRYWCHWPTPDAPTTILVPGVDEQSDVPAHWVVDTSRGIAMHSGGEVAA